MPTFLQHVIHSIALIASRKNVAVRLLQEEVRVQPQFAPQPGATLAVSGQAI
jgi:hypothetical protein